MSAADSKYTRRVFLARGGVAVGLAAVAPTILAACGKEEEGLNCASPPGMTPDERAKRGQFNYLEAAADPARKCSACTFFSAGAQATNACGPCTLGLGAVNPNGTCDSFAPRT